MEQPLCQMSSHIVMNHVGTGYANVADEIATHRLFTFIQIDSLMVLAEFWSSLPTLLKLLIDVV